MPGPMDAMDANGNFRWVRVDNNGYLITTSGGAGALAPIEKGRVYNTVYAGGGADVFAADLVVTNTPTCFRVVVCIDTATTVLAVRDNGVAEVDCYLNQAANLVADAEYAFDVYMTDDETFNMEFGAACQILYLLVTEVRELTG